MQTVRTNEGMRGIVLALMLVLTACEQPIAPQQRLLDELGNRLIIPWHHEFSTATAALHSGIVEFCQEPSAARLETIRQHWRDSMIRWQRVKHVRFGPITVDNQSWKIQFWPDKRNLIRKKVNQLLASEDILDVKRIKRASVAVQGLSALEFLLFDSEGGQLAAYQAPPSAVDATASSRRCQLLTAVAAHIQAVAAHLEQQWPPYLALLLQTGNNDIMLGAVVDSLVGSMRNIKEDKLAMPLGHDTKGDRPRPYLSEAWRSRQSLPNLAAAIDGARQWYSGDGGYGLDDYLIEKSNSDALAKQIAKNFERIQTLQRQISQPLFDAVTDKEQRQNVEQLYQATTALFKLLEKDVPATTGVALGFNADDGD